MVNDYHDTGMFWFGVVRVLCVCVVVALVKVDKPWKNVINRRILPCINVNNNLLLPWINVINRQYNPGKMYGNSKAR